MRGQWTTGAAAIAMLAATAAAAPQKHKKATTPPPPPAVRTVAMPIACPDALGVGSKTGRLFCEVAVSHDPTRGNLIVVPSHVGTATVRFHLHNRQLVSPSLIRAKRAYTKATATVVVVAQDGRILGRGTVQTEFRREADALDRVPAGAGASGSKAVAPVGDELIDTSVAEGIDAVVVVGEKVEIEQPDGTQTVNAEASPVALISSAQIEYRPTPVAPAAKPKPAKKRKPRG
jgi:hypothetical protein